MAEPDKRQEGSHASNVGLTYDLHELPTAQHRAGLAGLLLLRRSMEQRHLGPLPAVEFLDDDRVRLELTRETLDALFNELYDAVTEEVEVRTRWKDAEVVRTFEREELDQRTKKTKNVTFYVHHQKVPLAGFLRALGSPEISVKLWRSAIWGTVRGIPKTRTPYDERSCGKPTNEATKLWKSLVKQAKEPTFDRTEAIASSLYLGAREHSAEKVAFTGLPHHNLLLHFWPVAMRVFVPETIDRDAKAVRSGYVLALPDVGDLTGFLEEFPAALASTGTEARGYLPSDAIISVPQQGALEYLHSLLALARARATAGDIRFTVAAVEVYHLDKRGNNIVTLGTARVVMSEALLRRYDTIRKQFRDPLFLAQSIRNLLGGEPWYRGFDSVLSVRPAKQLIGRESRFAYDALTALKQHPETEP